MSSNGLWKVTSQTPSIMETSNTQNGVKRPIEDSQDEPLDFSQKSASTTASEYCFSRTEQTLKRLKTENVTVRQNAENKFAHTEFMANKEYYLNRNIQDKQPSAIQQNNFLNGMEKIDHESTEQVHFQIRHSSPKVDVRNPSTDFEAIQSPIFYPQSDPRSNRSTPRSSEVDVHCTNSSSPETDSHMMNGREQHRSPDSSVNRMGLYNGERVTPSQMNGPLPIYMVPSTSSDISHLTQGSMAFSAAGMMNNANNQMLRSLSNPVANPVNAIKEIPTNVATVPPYQFSFSSVPNNWPVNSHYSQSPILQAQLQDKKSTKYVRPFKAMTEEIIRSVNPDFAGFGSAPTLDQCIKQYSSVLDHMTKDAAENIFKNGLPKEVETEKVYNPELPSTSRMTKYDCQSTTTNGHGEISSSPEVKGNNNNDPSTSPPQNDESQQQSSPDNGNTGRKRGKRYPENQKDYAYYVRRKKNNEAAKRSRDARRRKEDALALTAKELMAEKIKLTMHLAYQNEEIKKLEEENRLLKEKEFHLKNYMYHLQSRCRNCRSCNNLNPDKRPE